MVQAFDDTRPRPLRAAPASAAERPRVPPHDLEAEESLLGAMLLSNDAASVGIETCSAATSTSRRTGTSSGPSGR